MTVPLSQVLSRSGMTPYERSSRRRLVVEERSIYCSSLVKGELVQASSSFDHKQLVGMTAVLNRFVEGNEVAVETPTLRGRSAEIKGLKGYNDKLFEMRFFEIAPQIRILGVFVMRDVFLAFQIHARSRLDNNWSECCQRVLRQISAMGKDAPECLSHSNMDLVLSNWRIVE